MFRLLNFPRPSLRQSKRERYHGKRYSESEKHETCNCSRNLSQDCLGRRQCFYRTLCKHTWVLLGVGDAVVTGCLLQPLRCYAHRYLFRTLLRYALQRAMRVRVAMFQILLHLESSLIQKTLHLYSARMHRFQLSGDVDSFAAIELTLNDTTNQPVSMETSPLTRRSRSR